MERVFQALSTFRDRVFSFNASGNVPTRWGSLVLIFLGLAFLAIKVSAGDLHLVHLLFVLGIWSLYFLSKTTRQFLIISIPVVIYAVMYDFFRYIPFESLLPIRVKELFEIDLLFFGIPLSGEKVLFHKFILEKFSSVFFDVYSGFFYFLHVPMFLILIVVFWRGRSAELAQRYMVAFLFMNIITNLTYFFYPAAAPWYVEKFGFLQPLGPVPGDAAGLVKFERILGLNFFTENYHLGPVVFGAIPSMHAGFAMLGWLYSFQVNRKLAFALGVFVLSMSFSALYLQHHYMIDLVIGYIYALAAWGIVEKFLKGPVARSYTKLNMFLVKEKNA